MHAQTMLAMRQCSQRYFLLCCNKGTITWGRGVLDEVMGDLPQGKGVQFDPWAPEVIDE